MGHQVGSPLLEAMLRKANAVWLDVCAKLAPSRLLCPTLFTLAMMQAHMLTVIPRQACQISYCSLESSPQAPPALSGVGEAGCGLEVGGLVVWVGGGGVSGCWWERVDV